MNLPHGLLVCSLRLTEETERLVQRHHSTPGTSVRQKCVIGFVFLEISKCQLLALEEDLPARKHQKRRFHDLSQLPGGEALFFDTMDPFSIAVGTVGLCDVCARVIAYLVHINEVSGKIQGEITILRQEIDSLLAVNESVRDLHGRRPDLGNLSLDDASHVNKVWQNLGILLAQCKGAILELEKLLNEVLGKKGTRVAGKIDGLKKAIRREARDDEYLQIRQRLGNYQAGIQMLLITLNLCVYASACIRGRLADATQRLHACIAYGKRSRSRQTIGQPAAPKYPATSQDGQVSPGN